MNKSYLIRIDLSDLIELSAQRRPEIEVGTLPHEVRKYLGCSRDTIYLSDKSLLHILQKHGDHISAEEISLLPQMLFTGVWLSDDRSTHAIASCEIKAVRYKIVVKVTEDRRRTYVVTIHRISKRQTKSLFRKNTLRDAW